MTRKPGKPARPQPGVRVRKAGPVIIPHDLPEPLQRFATPERASLFDGPLTKVTAEHLRKVTDVIGPLTPELPITLYRSTENPLWLWYSLAGLKTPGQILPETFNYLVDAANKIMAGIIEQVRSLENVQITPGEELEDGITNQSRSRLDAPNLLEILRTASSGVNLFKSAAANLRDIGYAIAVDNYVRETSVSIDDACAALAQAVGRTSAETGPAVASIKHMAANGRQLLRDPGKKRS